ncbi:hypothetical protein RJ641_027412 [Dillenia turbinata]|uniref:Uncharacterized protein n=1 Tax=Dillenia turbinata TaxID=194707 RepID=A0AAN8VX97_9MAGN
MVNDSMFNEKAIWRDMKSGSSQTHVIENRGRTKGATCHIKRNCRLLKEKKDEKGKSVSDDSNVAVCEHQVTAIMWGIHCLNALLTLVRHIIVFPKDNCLQLINKVTLALPK